MTDSLRCALFVDFDNVYIGLRRLDPEAAEAFATQPGVWLAALAEGADLDVERRRRFLVQACYLNPSAFAQFRPNFTRAGFRVVDCPSLTQQGKSSADINLVLDAVDALNAGTHYDEFVIVSADADFTPLVQRFRAADRQVTIVTASPAAAAYRAVADSVVTADDLTRLVRPAEPDLVAEGGGSEGSAAPAGKVSSGTAAGGKGRRQRSGGGGRGSDATDPTTAGDTDGSTTTAPGGTTGGARRSAAADGSAAPDGSAASDGSTTSDGSAASDGAATDRSSGSGPAADGQGAGGAARTNGERRGISRNRAAARAVRRLVRRADRPLNGSAAARAAQEADPTLDGSWDGAGGFSAWLTREVPDIAAGAGFVWDPERFSEGDLPGKTPDLPPLQRQVVEVTDIPHLTTERYRALHTAIAEDLAAHTFDRPVTVRRVYEACQAAGEAIGRGSVNAVVAGVLYAGLELGPGVTAEQIAQTWTDHVVGLVQGARMELTPQDAAALRSWVGGGLVPVG